MVYYQDCGGNSLSFAAVDASCDATAFLTAGGETGVSTPNGHTFTEEVVLYANNPAYAIGPCSTYLVYTSDGYTHALDASTKYISTIQYTFNVEIIEGPPASVCTSVDSGWFYDASTYLSNEGYNTPADDSS